MNGHDEPVELILEDDSEVTASVVLAAPGMDWTRLDLDGIDDLVGGRRLLRRGPKRGRPVRRPDRRRGRGGQLRRSGRSQTSRTRRRA
jgi:hypothetical protein